MIVVSLPLAFIDYCIFHNFAVLKIRVTCDSGSELKCVEEKYLSEWLVMAAVDDYVRRCQRMFCF
jgi:hypothetical protein